MGDSRTNPEIAQLEAEMKLLKWHKLANETALQAALLSTKQIKQHDKLLKAQSIEQERLDMVDRKKKIADEEYAKPLPVCFRDLFPLICLFHLARLFSIEKPHEKSSFAILVSISAFLLRWI
mmetsp:Transcript_23717/g.35615  ORF Transcript_23717/g.35615 Transcript_23717/m.35615 type:complete len:122 (+) Transcript_23717:142-507(+)